MSVESVAARYAQALFELGNESSSLPALTDEIQRFASVYSESDDLRSVVDNPLVADKDRFNVLNEVCQRLGLGPVSKNAILLLAERRRLAVIPYVARDLTLLADEKAGAVRAMVTTAAQLPDSFFAKLKSELEKATGKKVQLERSVDPSLLGGVVTRIGDKVIDGSLRTRLETMKRTILN